MRLDLYPCSETNDDALIIHRLLGELLVLFQYIIAVHLVVADIISYYKEYVNIVSNSGSCHVLVTNSTNFHLLLVS